MAGQSGGLIGTQITLIKSTGSNEETKFTSPGTWAPDGAGSKLLDVLIVAGGGGGGAGKGGNTGNNSNGGGGAGGVLFLQNVPHTHPAPKSVTIGGGGAGATGGGTASPAPGCGGAGSDGYN